MLLECKELCKKYGDFTAIERMTYSFSEGVYGLLGPNGAGKSTLMKVLTSTLKPTTGQVLCDGRSIGSMGQSYVENIGYVPQNQNMFSYFTGKKFLYYMAVLKGVEKEVAKEQIPMLLKRVNLVDAANKKIGAYSGGMKQRLLIAQAFLGNPKVVFMDEPTAGLDPKERIRVRNFISEMAMDKIIIIATHVVSDVEFISKEILLMKKGEIIQNGTAELLEDNISGIVYETEVEEKELEKFVNMHLVAGIRKEQSRIIVRFIEEERGVVGKVVRPTLDDVYLFHFKEEEAYGLE